MVPRDAQDSDRKRSSSKSIDDLSDEEASEFLGALKAYVRANAPALLRDPNVTSVGIGYRTIKGKPQTKDGKPVLLEIQDAKNFVLESLHTLFSETEAVLP